jgi:glycolate oxidase
MMAARADIVEMGVAPEQAIRIRDHIEKTGNPYGEEKSQLVGWLESRPETADVLYFAGCTASYRRPEVAKSAMALLERDRAVFTTLDDEPCCGEPLYVMGFRNEAKARAEHTLERIQAAGARTVVSSCPTGIDTFRHGYREWGVETPDGIRFLHISEYIAEQIEAGRLQMSRPLNVSLTYHDPCSLGREMQVYEAPRQVLSAVPGTELREMRLNRGHSPCCGNGGGVPATNSNIAHGAGKNAGDVILETGAEVLITACPSCKQSLMHHVPGMEVLDIAELVGRAL